MMLSVKWIRDTESIGNYYCYLPKGFEIHVSEDMNYDEEGHWEAILLHDDTRDGFNDSHYIMSWVFEAPDLRNAQIKALNQFKVWANSLVMDLEALEEK